MIPARLDRRPTAGTTFRAYSGGRLLAEVVCLDGGDTDRLIDDMWNAVEATVAGGHQVLLVAYDSATGLPLPIGDRTVAASGVTQQ